ncbi:uncharacterized protein LOC141679779 [Apium graveolens]|uniref:uncharacterized protein LOC141679779 n=1 Tax=Apium graveolens TaxID=4045 RepID=UPI003D7A4BE1
MDEAEFSRTHDHVDDPSDLYEHDEFLDGAESWSKDRLERAGKFPTEYSSLGPPNVQCSKCHAMMWKEERTNKNVTKATPQFSLCCANGEIRLQKEQSTPSYLWQLYNDKQKGPKFKDIIRIYNSMFAFTSTGGRVDHSINCGGAPYIYRLNGQNHHIFGSLIPDDGNDPMFCQLYIYDTSNEIANRMKWISVNDGQVIHVEIVEGLIRILDETNELVKEFRSHRDRFEQDKVADLEITLKVSRVESEMENHIIPADDVAGIMVGDLDDNSQYRDIIIHSKENHMQRVTDIYPKIMALQYPLLFPHDDDGFHIHLPYGIGDNKKRRKRVLLTQKEYYSYKLQVRLNEGMTPRLGGRLFQQYVVDVFATIEQARLWYIRTHQPKLRNDLYRQIYDSLSSGNTDASAVGKGIVLPAIFIGSRSPDAKKNLQSNVDKFVSAEVPDPDEDPAGYSVVQSFMIHGPCGSENPKSLCMKDFKCIRNYPKKYSATTTFDDSGFRIYRRQKKNLPKAASGKEKQMDNKWGHDRATVEIKRRKKDQSSSNNDLLVDEIKQYFNGERNCTFKETEPLPKVVARERNKLSHLEAFFQLNYTDPEARKFTYDEIPRHYVWNELDTVWNVRKRGLQIGRLFYTHHGTGELWYLRLLLTKVRGPTSFKHLSTVNGKVCLSFQDACREYGLLDDDNEWHQVMQQCSMSGLATQICQLKLSGNPDLVLNNKQLEYYALVEIHKLLKSIGKSLKDFNQMPQPPNIYLDCGSGGCGKTFMWKMLIPKLRSESMIVLHVASSDIAATLLPGGRTAHSSLIIWDEAPMQHRYAFECLDRSLRDIMKSVEPRRFHIPFGGINIVLGGDFCQILPVIPGSSRSEVVDSEIERAANGAFEDDICIPAEFCNVGNENYIDDMIDSTFPEFSQHFSDPTYLSERAILTHTNNTVAHVNALIVERIHGESQSYYSVDHAEDYPGTKTELNNSFPQNI